MSAPEPERTLNAALVGRARSSPTYKRGQCFEVGRDPICAKPGSKRGNDLGSSNKELCSPSFHLEIDRNQYVADGASVCLFLFTMAVQPCPPERQSMPLHLEPRDISADLERFSSVLIVLCPICPPMSLAMQRDSPFIEFFKSGFKTGAFEDYIQSIRQPLEQRGVRTGAYVIYTPTPTMCIWTKGQRNRLLKRARDYEAVVVLGCGSAAHTVQETLRNTACNVIQGMRTAGITNATLTVRFPLTITLDMHHVLRNDAGRQPANDARGR